MKGSQSVFQHLDETHNEYIRFGDGSRVRIHRRGNILLHCQNGGMMELNNVLSIPKLKSNILTLRQLDE